MIRCTCEQCGEVVLAPDGAAGKRGRCPVCKTVFVLPQQSTDQAAAPAQPSPPPPSAEAAPQPRATDPPTPQKPDPTDTGGRKVGVLVIAGAAGLVVALAVGGLLLMFAGPTSPAGDPNADPAGAKPGPGRGGTGGGGFYAPGEIQLEARVLRTVEVPDWQRVITVSPNGKRMLCGYRVIDRIHWFVRGEEGDPGSNKPDGAKERISAYWPMRTGSESLGWRDRPLFSRNSEHYAFVLEVGPDRAKQYVVVCDRKRYGPYAYAGHLCFSVDGKRFAFFCKKSDGLHRAVVDGKEGPTFSKLMHQTRIDIPNQRYRYYLLPLLLFSPDAQHVAYAAIRTIGRTQRYEIVRDGKVIHTAIWASQPRWSPDGRLAFFAQTSGKADSAQRCLYVEGKAGPAFGYVVPGSLCFSPTGKDIAFVAADPKPGGAMFVVRNGIKGKGRHIIFPKSLTFDDRGQLTYTAGVPTDPGQRGQRYAAVHPAGRRSYQREVYICDGKEGPRAMSTTRPGATSAPAVARGRRGAPNPQVLLRTARRLLDRPGVYFDAPSRASRSPDGQHIAFLPRDKRAVVVDGIFFPLRISGAVAGLSFQASDTLILLTADERNKRIYRYVEAKLVPVAPMPDVAVATPQRVDPVAAEMAARLTRLTQVAQGNVRLQNRLRYLTSVVYAVGGDKTKALAAVGSDAPETAVNILSVAQGAQIARGDSSGAARTAAEILQYTLRIEGIGLPAQSRQFYFAVSALALLDDPAALNEAMALPQFPRGSHRNVLLSQVARGLAEAGHMEAAGRICDKVTDDATAGKIRLAMADRCEKGGKKAEAVKAHLAALPALRRSKDNWGRAMALAGLCRCGQVDAAAQALLAVDPADPLRLYLLEAVARTQAEAGDLPGAIKTARQGGHLLLTAELEIRNGRAEQAAQDLRRVLLSLAKVTGASPRGIPALIRRANLARAAAVLLFRCGQTDEAVRIVQALAALPRQQGRVGNYSPGPIVMEGVCEPLDKGRPEPALAVVRRKDVSGITESHLCQLWARIAVAQWRNGDKTTARASLKKAELLAAKNPKGLHHVAINSAQAEMRETGPSAKHLTESDRPKKRQTDVLTHERRQALAMAQLAEKHVEEAPPGPDRPSRTKSTPVRLLLAAAKAGKKDLLLDHIGPIPYRDLNRLIEGLRAAGKTEMIQDVLEAALDYFVIHPVLTFQATQYSTIVKLMLQHGRKDRASALLGWLVELRMAKPVPTHRLIRGGDIELRKLFRLMVETGQADAVEALAKSASNPFTRHTTLLAAAEAIALPYPADEGPRAVPMMTLLERFGSITLRFRSAATANDGTARLDRRSLPAPPYISPQRAAQMTPEVTRPLTNPGSALKS